MTAAVAASAIREWSGVGSARLLVLSGMLLAGVAPVAACEQPPEVAFPSREDDRPVPAAKHARGAYALEGGALLLPVPTASPEGPGLGQDGGVPARGISPEAGGILSSDAGAPSLPCEVAAEESVAL